MTATIEQSLIWYKCDPKKFRLFLHVVRVTTT